jgi:tRNA A-37 threonylcarbamoyl transferase component Bud32
MRDVTPDNILVEDNKMTVVDFSLFKRYLNPTTGLHVPLKES